MSKSPPMDMDVSPGSALDILMREAEEDTDNDVDDDVFQIPVHPAASASGQKISEWTGRKNSFIARLRTPQKQLSMQDLDRIFPDVNGPSKPKLNRWKTHQLRQTKSKRQAAAVGRQHALSDMGLFGRLPGELRNYIYRLAFVSPPEEQPILIEGSDLICGRGACVHKKAPIVAPGIASSCRQLRQELIPIFCAENSFKFDAVMVRNRCCGSWAKSMNNYARFIPRVVLEILICTRQPDGSVTTELEEIIIKCPVATLDGRFDMVVGKRIPKEKLGSSGLEKLIEKMNDGEQCGRASKLAYIGASEELAELVFRCKK